MHGHGYAPPQPGRPADGTLVALRVIFIAVSVLSCSFLAWVPMLRLAVLTRKAVDWALLVATLLSTIGILVFLAVAVPENEDEISDATALTFLGWVSVVMVGVIAYYVTAESRHYERVAPRLQPQLPPGVTGYGYPPVAQPPVPNPYAQPVQPPVQPPVGQQYTPPVPQPPVAEPQQQHHPRIDQVRAELDELSDILRKGKDQREGGR
ncbi:hypothetical protein ACWCXB_19365 [Streptomyces sp. NPDC001514]